MTRWSFRLWGVGVSMLLCPLIHPEQAFCETLAEAITLAYSSNPTLLSQRAQLQATDETYVQAEAGFRPTLGAQASANYTKEPEASLFGGSVETLSNTGTAQLSATQPLYTGGKVTAEVRAAESQIRAGREQLRSVEANVLFSVIQAYCDVLRDRASLKIQRDSFAALQDAVEEIRARREAGANTLTDVVQAEAQLESSEVLVNSAEAQLEISNAEYISAVGRSPGNLTAPPPLPDVPLTLDEAFDISERESPSIRQAQFAEAASRANIQEARAGLRPTSGLSASLGDTGTLQPFIRKDYQRIVTITATINQPLFAGGALASQIRAAIAQDTAARIQVSVAERNVIQSVAQAWSQKHAAELNNISNEAAVKAAKSAFDGMRIEYRAGLRATLDVLIAQETLRDSQISLVNSEHDDYVATASLLEMIGRLEVRVLVLGVPIYQPQASLRRVENIGSVPWQGLPSVLDQVGAPGLPRPGDIPEPPPPSGSIRITPIKASQH